MLCAVAVHLSPDRRQHKTIFRSDGFNCSEFVAKIIDLIKSEQSEELCKVMAVLADQLEEKQEDLTKAERDFANRGDAVMFPSDVFHAAAAPHEPEQDFPRITAYMQFVPRIVVENEEWWPLLRTLYSPEEVFDRRTMVAPAVLQTMMRVHSEDPLVVEGAGRWLSALCKGCVNCIQS